MEALEPLALGVALGGVVLLVLAKFPGEPFDYDAMTHDNTSGQHTAAPKAVDGAMVCCEKEDNVILPEAATVEHSEALAQERAARKRKIQELQQLLGVEAQQMQRLLSKAQEQTSSASSSSSSAARYSSYFDAFFYVAMAGALALVLSTEYSVDLGQLLAYVFPREAATLRQLLSAVPFWQ